ncbi:hypothetical protein BH11PAT1_BH11PAT1_3360 [soil metagenome]
MQKGFTLIELIIVISISSLLVGFTYSSFRLLNQSQALGKDANMVSTVLHEARAETLASKNGNQYGVHFETSKIVLFIGPTYNSVTSTNINFPFNTLVTISTISILGGGSEVVFDRLTGDTSKTGTITLSLTSTPTSIRTITVSGAGLIEVAP